MSRISLTLQDLQDDESCFQRKQDGVYLTKGGGSIQVITEDRHLTGHLLGKLKVSTGYYTRATEKELARDINPDTFRCRKYDTVTQEEFVAQVNKFIARFTK